MFHSYLTHSEYRTVLDQTPQDRAELISRAGYVAVVGIEDAATSVYRHAASGLHRLGAALDRWQRRRQTIGALSRLDPRLLRDVGIDPHRFASDGIDAVAESLAATGGELSEATWPVARSHPDVPVLRLDLDCPEARAERRLVA